MAMENNSDYTYVRNNCDEVYYIHDVFEEGNFARTCEKPNDELEREPNLTMAASCSGG